MKYKKGDWVYIDYNGDKPPYPFEIVLVEGNYRNYIIYIHKPYRSITGWEGGSWWMEN